MGEATRLGTRQAVNLATGDTAAVPDDVGEAVGRAVEQAVSNEGPRAREWLRRQRQERGGHWLCSLLEEVAVGLAELTPTALVNSFTKEACQALGLGPFSTVAVTAAVEKVTEAMAATIQFTSPLDQFLHLARVGALATCPNTSEHPSLQRTCESKLAGSAMSDIAESVAIGRANGFGHAS